MCGGCDKKVTKPSAQCKCCSLWYHIGCGGLKDELHKLIVACVDMGGGHAWSCTSCLGAMDSINKRVLAIESRFKAMENQMTDHSTHLKEVDNRLDKIEQGSSSNKEELRQAVDTTKDDVFRELSEREARKENLIVHKLPESAATLPSEKKESDKKDLVELFQPWMFSLTLVKTSNSGIEPGTRAAKQPPSPDLL